MFTDKETFKSYFEERFEKIHGKSVDEATPMDLYKTLGNMIREFASKDWIKTNKKYQEKGVKQVYYLSMEFLLGRLLGSNLLNLGIRDVVEAGLKDLGFNLDEIEEQEPDAGLGNGGLGRLAACFLDSLASMNLPGHGGGIRYKYGLFEQKIVNGYQVELPEYWLKEGNVWEIRKSDKAEEVRFGGHVDVHEREGRLVFDHQGYEPVLAVPYDTPVVGYENRRVNTLRLWNAESALDELDCHSLNLGCYSRIVEYKHFLESISEFLYPDDSHYEGRVLRLKQQYFLVSATVQSLVRRYKKKHGSIQNFHEKIGIHINDTHPTLAIPELMRVLMDQEGLNWEDAWRITTSTISYTNHTTLAEALEKWPVELFKTLLPRIFMIVEEINERFSRELWHLYPGDWDRISRMAIVGDGQVRMAHLAIVGSHSVNGVAHIHTEILKTREMQNFYQVYPHKFNNKTNGITHRRWLLKANPRLAGLVTEAIGPGWIRHPEDLAGLLKYTGDKAFQDKIAAVKRENKAALAAFIKEKQGIEVDVNSIFDVQIKRLHAYKRQVMNALHIMELYKRLKEDPDLDINPRTFIFGAKASPSYDLAKRVIKLINSLAEVVNKDKEINQKLKVVFMENYRVSLAEIIIPAAEVSQQISTASKEASGTGNMKLMLNGAITLGTLDGANVEIMEEVGKENIFTFGLTSREVLDFYHYGGYSSRELCQEDTRLRTLVEQLVNGFFPAAREEFYPIYEALVDYNDEYFVLRDFAAYAKAQEDVDKAYRDRDRWLKMSINNMARAGRFSSDRTIGEYGAGIWDISPVYNSD